MTSRGPCDLRSSFTVSKNSLPPAFSSALPEKISIYYSADQLSNKNTDSNFRKLSCPFFQFGVLWPETPLQQTVELYSFFSFSFLVPLAFPMFQHRFSTLSSIKIWECSRTFFVCNKTPVYKFIYNINLYITEKERKKAQLYGFWLCIYFCIPSASFLLFSRRIHTQFWYTCKLYQLYPTIKTAWFP